MTNCNLKFQEQKWTPWQNGNNVKVLNAFLVCIVLFSILNRTVNWSRCKLRGHKCSSTSNLLVLFWVLLDLNNRRKNNAFASRLPRDMKNILFRIIHFGGDIRNIVTKKFLVSFVGQCWVRSTSDSNCTNASEVHPNSNSVQSIACHVFWNWGQLYILMNHCWQNHLRTQNPRAAACGSFIELLQSIQYFEFGMKFEIKANMKQY